MKKTLAIITATGALAIGGVQVLPAPEYQEATVRELVAQYPHAKEDIKGLRIAQEVNANGLKKHIRDEYTIELVEVKKIDNGVEVFARAWKDGKQIGFGKDGSVDMERFRIFNPPVLVPDPQGDIVQEWTDETTGKALSRTLREDPQEALIQVVEHNLSVMKNIHGDEKIVQGKRGNTTSTFYPSAGEVEPFDGYQGNDGGNHSWDFVHDATSTASFTFPINNDTGTTMSLRAQGGSDAKIDRIMTLFDTSSIPDDDDISSATVSLYATAQSADADSDQIALVQANPASTSQLSAGDFDQYGDAVNNPTEGASRIDATITTSAYNDVPLNATGIGWILKTGITKLAFRFGKDCDDVTPSSTGTQITFSQADQTGTSQDPKLVVEHSAAATSNAGAAAMTGMMF